MTDFRHRYTTCFKVWRKTNRDGTPVCSPGWWSRSSCEFLLVGVLASAKGSILEHKTTNSEPQEFASVRGAHSSKPIEITQAVADFLDVDKRLELFARATHPQFDSWGAFVHIPSPVDLNPFAMHAASNGKLRWALYWQSFRKLAS